MPNAQLLSRQLGPAPPARARRPAGMGSRRAAVIAALVALAAAIAAPPGARAAATGAARPAGPGVPAPGVWHTRLRTGDISTTPDAHG
jgi:hypothetical protein